MYTQIIINSFRVEGGELFERVIGDDFVLTEKAVTIFMRQICEGVQFIHSKNILHLDLKVFIHCIIFTYIVYFINVYVYCVYNLCLNLNIIVLIGF